MIYAVIGAGPRTGTSFVMRKLHEAGLPVFWHADFYAADEGNPQGYYESRPESYGQAEGQIQKIWPNAKINYMGIQGAVLLRRLDRAAHIRSIRVAMEREGFSMDLDAAWFLDRSVLHAQSIAFDHREFATERLDDDIDEIIGYFHQLIEKEAA